MSALPLLSSEQLLSTAQWQNSLQSQSAVDVVS